MSSRIILDKKQIDILIHRFCYELIERHENFKDLALIGMQPRGIYLSRRIHEKLQELSANKNIRYGELDIAFYRDDFRRGKEQIIPSKLSINFNISELKVVLIDDVLYTGRSIRSALDALTDFGRPDKVELMVLIDRKFSRDLPIQPDYTGISVDTRSNDKVKVEWKESGGIDQATIITTKQK